jgi:hypothetical protein
MNQTQVLLKHLRKAGSISQREAIMDHSIQSLTRRITDLRLNGYNILGEWKEHPVSGQRYMRYTLGSPEIL